MSTIQLSTPGAVLSVSEDCLTISFDRPRQSLSTAIFGGGERRVRWILNQKLTGFYKTESDFPGGSVENFLKLCAQREGAVPEEAAVLLTAAKVQLFSHKVFQKGDLLVEIITTGGCGRTACRASSPALYEEHDGHFFPLGTVNMMVLVNGSLPPGIMARALITLTEGKAAAFNDEGIADINNGRPATGTGTDGITLVTDPEGPRYTDAGPFSLLGSFLARAAHDSVTECLEKYDKPWNAFPELKTPEAVDLEEKRKR